MAAGIWAAAHMGIACEGLNKGNVAGMWLRGRGLRQSSRKEVAAIKIMKSYYRLGKGV